MGKQGCGREGSVRDEEVARTRRTIRRLREQLEECQATQQIRQRILDSAGDGIYCVDANGLTTFVNPATTRLTGWSEAEMLHQPEHLLIHHSHANGEHYRWEECPVTRSLRDGRPQHNHADVFWRKDGTSFPVSYSSTPLLSAGQVAGAVVVFRDVSEKQRLAVWEKEKSTILQAITSHQPVDLVLAMIANAYLSCHPAQAIAFHLREQTALRLIAQAGMSGAFLPSLRVLDLNGADQPCVQAALQAREVQAEGAAAGLPECSACDRCWSLPLTSNRGELLGTLTLWRKAGDPCFADFQELVRSARDMAIVALEHSRLYEELRHQSQHDALTGLPNRLLLEDRLEQAVKQARRQETLVGVCFLDLDRFKRVNDSCGHAVGDELLRHLANLLRTNLREFDTITRQGGDEFIMVLPGLTSLREAEEICQRLAAKVGQLVTIGHHALKPTASVGISLFPTHGTQPGTLLKRADMALYRAKHGGGNRVQTFEEEFERDSHWNAELQLGLPLARDRGEFSLAYQPVYDAGGCLVAFEALLRWHHPTLGLLLPQRFLPIAEETSLITSIGDWVLQEACGQAYLWNVEAPAPVRILVNLSGVQLTKPEFSARVAEILHATSLDPRLLELEIPEAWYIDADRAHPQLQSVRALGVGISIDDFGSEHACFAYLQDRTADTVKIDRSFIARLDGSERSSATVRSIIALATQLGMNVVAVGVETEAQRQELLQAGCPLLQGYLLSRPLPAAAATRLLRGMQTSEPCAWTEDAPGDPTEDDCTWSTNLAEKSTQ
jgi:diguanylate cyclase (GGDEF)-like protein/PAS domain S-box-containing protein